MRDRPRGPGGPRRRARPRAASRRQGVRAASSTPGRATPPATSRAAAPASGTATRTSAPRPPGRFTGRAIVLGVVLVALALSYVFPLRIYLSQQADIAQLRDRQAAQRDYIEELEAEAARWGDDEYIRIQARKRLYFVEPGEVPMIIVWADEAGPEDEVDPAEVPVRPEEWWHTLWSSVEAADRGEPARRDGDNEDGGAADADGDGANHETAGQHRGE
jgi:cell division protein FtsB